MKSRETRSAAHQHPHLSRAGITSTLPTHVFLAFRQAVRHSGLSSQPDPAPFLFSSNKLYPFPAVQHFHYCTLAVRPTRFKPCLLARLLAPLLGATPLSHHTIYHHHHHHHYHICTTTPCSLPLPTWEHQPHLDIPNSSLPPPPEIPIFGPAIDPF